VRNEIGSVRNEMRQMDKRRVFCLPIAAVDRTKHIGQAPDGLVRLVGILVALLRKLIARELPSGQFLDALEQGIPPSSGDWPFSLSLLEIAARIRHDGTVRHPD
jgi:hypothetical protein